MNKKTIWAVIIALILVAGALVASRAFLSPKSLKYDVIFFGDSRVGNDRTETALSHRLGAETGLSVYNAGLGGTCLASADIDDVWNRYSMVELSEALRTGDFSTQLSSIPKELVEKSEILDYFEDSVRDISELDTRDVRYVIIEQGTNDYLGGIPIRNESDPYDKGTVEGALRVSIENIKKACPNATIVYISQCLTWTIPGYADELDLSFGTVEAYVEAERKIAEETGVVFIDFYHESGINRENLWTYLFDGLHPSELGNTVLIDLITEKLNLE